MNTDLFDYQYDKIMWSQLNVAQVAFLCEKVSFGLSPPPNCEGLACLIDEFV